MDVSKLSSGRDVPHDINIVVEIPAGSILMAVIGPLGR